MNVSELKNFYETDLGKFACRKIRAKITAYWHETIGEKILGIGFALPYLPLFSYGNSCIAFMPANIGALRIEESPPSVMVDSTTLPAGNEIFDRVVIIHGFENVPMPEKLLEEAWRVLKPNGKLFLVAPNENGTWLGSKSPFYKSRAFSRNKLREFLLFNKFAPRRYGRALFFIPTQFRLINKAGELFGRIFMRGSAGVLIFEAEKLIFGVGGRPIKIAPTIWDKIFKPKTVSA